MPDCGIRRVDLGARTRENRGHVELGAPGIADGRCACRPLRKLRRTDQQSARQHAEREEATGPVQDGHRVVFD
jgi:hypothetical protein